MIIRRTTNQGLSFLDVKTPLCTASLCLQGAHLTSWKPEGHEECLFLSPNAAFAPGKAIRGGIPVCWPWFGSRKDAPSHGIARTSEWRLHHQEMDKRGNVLLSLAFYPEDESYPAPYTGPHADHETGNHGAHASLQTHGSLPQLLFCRQPDQMPRPRTGRYSVPGRSSPAHETRRTPAGAAGGVWTVFTTFPPVREKQCWKTSC